MNVGSSQQQHLSHLDNSDDEFFEAQEMLTESADHMMQSVDDKSPPPWEGREGVLHQYHDLVLIATGEPLCVPITQVIAMVTDKCNNKTKLRVCIVRVVCLSVCVFVCVLYSVCVFSGCCDRSVEVMIVQEACLQSY